MQKLYCVYRFNGDFILLGAFAEESDALDFWCKKKADGMSDLYGDGNVGRPYAIEQTVKSLIEFLQSAKTGGVSA
jgi:hypothetical protein